ncbi:MAG: hypothetical protein GWP06_00010 [Actinobacteria bacterium]|nr:hypothetical protein [Actinomycetota bacterium]
MGYRTKQAVATTKIDYFSEEAGIGYSFISTRYDKVKKRLARHGGKGGLKKVMRNKKSRSKALKAAFIYVVWRLKHYYSRKLVTFDFEK